jgi:spore germination protein KC
MKKIIIVLITLFLITGCYDNVELNKLSIISGLGIDYIDDNYVITYEIYNSNKSDNTGDLLSDTITGTGNSISEAFGDANNKTSKKDFFSHLKVVILSESLIQNHFQDITDYLIRDTDIREEFYLLVSNNTSPSNILNHVSKKYPNASEYIVRLINNEKYNNSLPTKETYQKILSKLLSNKTDIVLNSITIIDDHISLSNSYVFYKYNYNNTLSLKDSSLYTLLMFDNTGIEYKYYYNNKPFIISISNVKNNIKIDNATITINSDMEAKVLENNSNLDLKDTNVYNMLNSDFSNIVKEDIISFIKLLQDNKTDLLGLQDIYYKTYNKDNYYLWEVSNVDINIDLKINYKGFIYEVDHE